MSLTPAAMRKLNKELVQLEANPPEGIRVITNEHDMLDFQAWVQGPAGTPYADGYFRIKFTFGPQFPAAPPKCTFATRIFHPNVNVKTGEICVSTLKKDWTKDYGVGHILLTVKCLLIHPNPESALHEEAGKLLLEAYDDYARHARIMTEVHARFRPQEFSLPDGSLAPALVQPQRSNPIPEEPAAIDAATHTLHKKRSVSTALFAGAAPTFATGALQHANTNGVVSHLVNDGSKKLKEASTNGVSMQSVGLLASTGAGNVKSSANGADKAKKRGLRRL